MCEKLPFRYGISAREQTQGCDPSEKAIIVNKQHLNQ
jgi:hypothetical protein